MRWITSAFFIGGGVAVEIWVPLSRLMFENHQRLHVPSEMGASRDQHSHAANGMARNDAMGAAWSMTPAGVMPALRLNRLP
jgi:hypothetical protein